MWIYNLKLRIMKIVLNNLGNLVNHKYTMFVIVFLIRSRDVIPIVTNEKGDKRIGNAMHLSYLEDPEPEEDIEQIEYTSFQELILEEIFAQFEQDEDLIYFLKGECGSNIIKEAISFSDSNTKSKLISMLIITVIKNVDKLTRIVQTHKIMGLIMQYWQLCRTNESMPEN